MIEYYNNYFAGDFSRLRFNSPNSTILRNPQSFLLQPGDLFFGGRNWENYNNDISHLNNMNFEYFVLCLFATQTINYFSAHNPEIPIVTAIGRMPFLGWSGYGPHWEHPLAILTSHCADNNIVGFIENNRDNLNGVFNLFLHNNNK
jgi:hypothetical protein